MGAPVDFVLFSRYSYFKYIFNILCTTNINLEMYRKCMKNSFCVNISHIFHSYFHSYNISGRHWQHNGTCATFAFCNGTFAEWSIFMVKSVFSNTIG